MHHAARPDQRDWRDTWVGFALAVAAAIGVAVVTWTVLYPLLGFGTWTRVTAHLSFFAVAIALVGVLRIAPGRLGLGPRQLTWAVTVTAIAYAVVMAGAGLLNGVAGTDFAVVRARYDPIAFLDTWVLTALGEELLFAGVVFVAALRALPRPRRAWAVPLTALAFAAMHLPGYLAIGYPIGSVLGRLALNAVSWGVFGTIYLLSGNLWLVVLAHAATDLGVTPLITSEPAFGLVFMALLVVGAWAQGRRDRAVHGPPTPP